MYLIDVDPLFVVENHQSLMLPLPCLRFPVNASATMLRCVFVIAIIDLNISMLFLISRWFCIYMTSGQFCIIRVIIDGIAVISNLWLHDQCSSPFEREIMRLVIRIKGCGVSYNGHWVTIREYLSHKFGPLSLRLMIMSLWWRRAVLVYLGIDHLCCLIHLNLLLPFVHFPYNFNWTWDRTIVTFLSLCLRCDCFWLVYTACTTLVHAS